MNNAKNTKKYSRNTFLIILMVVFTLGLTFSLFQYFTGFSKAGIEFTPGSMTFPDGGEFQVPEGGDFQMPEGGDFQIPENGNFSRPDGSGFPGGQDMESSTDQRPGRQTVSPVRSLWLIVAGVCFLGDLLCLIALLRRRKLARLEESDQEDEEGEDDEPPHQRKIPWLAILSLVMIGAMVLTSFPTAQGQGSSATVQEKVLDGTPEAVQMDVVLTGTGTLATDASTSVSIPQEVKVLRYHVQNGAAVQAGDPLVSVDKTTAATAMMELHELLLELDDDLEAQRTKTESTSITADVAGRVKKIYVNEGDLVADVLYEHGALMLLSLDGRMKVVFESDQDLQVGTSVVVTLSDGSRETGSVDSLREGVVTVTISDEGAPCGDSVTVLDESGAHLGSGILEISSELRIVNHYGTVSRLNVKENTKVAKGTCLITLKDTGHTAQYQLLLARRQELEEQISALSELAATGVVRAEIDGIVSGVPDDAQIELLSAGDQGFRIILLSNTSEPDDSGAEPPTEGSPEPPAQEDTKRTGVYAASLVSSGSGKLYVWLSSSPVSEDADLTSLRMLMNQFDEFPYTGGSDITLTQNSETKTVRLEELKSDDLLLLRISEDTVTEIIRAQRSSSQGGGQFPSGGSGFGGYGGMGSGQTATPGYESYVISEQELLTLNHREIAQVDIQIDELDILSLRAGLAVQITLDAMRGRSFTGTITRIGTVGTNEGGNTKFTVTVTFPREADMLDGMNASVEIITDSYEAAICIPAAALVEDDGKTYVYTAYDPEKDAFSGKVEVQTGLSDGEWVEIVSGLTAEDTYYYRYAGTVTYNFLSA